MNQIAVDGPSGAGKGVLSREVGRRLGYIYVDTGSMYRAVGLYMYRRGVDPRDSAAILRLLPGVKLSIEYRDSIQHIILCGEEIPDEKLRTPEITRYAHLVSALGPVRDLLNSTLHRLAESSNVIMDGRDIGTVIFPNAICKIYLTANTEVRAQRRFKELTERGIDTTYRVVLESIIERDTNDSTREIAPAIAADDAVILDNSELDEMGTIRAALDIVAKAGVEVPPEAYTMPMQE